MTKGLPNDLDVYVGARVRSCRERRGLTQGALARQLGISFQQLQKYEKGSNRISVGRLQIISQVLQVPIEQFFNGVDEQAALSDKNPYPDPTQFVETVEGLELIRSYRRISSPETRGRILDLVRTLASQEPQSDETDAGVHARA